MIDKNTPIGTRCRIIGTKMNHQFKIGTEVTIRENLTDAGNFGCNSSSNSLFCYCDPSDLELVLANPVSLKQYSEVSILERLWSKEKLFSENFPNLEGYSRGENCNRNGCKGIIYESEKEGSCTCHRGNPPCGYCTTSNAYCDTCSWEADPI